MTDNDNTVRLTEACERRGRAAGKQYGWRWGQLSAQLYMLAVFFGLRALLPAHYWTRLLGWERYAVGALALVYLAGWVWVEWTKRP